MAVHLGKLLRELYLGSGLKMERFRELVNYSSKTIYYHFGQEHLNTQILENYEAGMRRMGHPIDLWELVARKRRGEEVADVLEPSMLHEPKAPYYRPETAAEHLRRAAELMEREAKSPAPDRDKGEA